MKGLSKRIARLSRVLAMVAVGLTGPAAAEEPVAPPVVKRVSGTAIGAAEDIGNGWLLQAWGEEKARSCLIGKRAGKASLNIAADADGDFALTIWEGGAGLTDDLMGDELAVHLTGLGDGHDRFLEEAAWEFGVVTIPLDATLVGRFAGMASMDFQLLPSNGKTVTADLAGIGPALTKLKDCAAKPKAKAVAQAAAQPAPPTTAPAKAPAAAPRYAAQASREGGAGPVVWAPTFEAANEAAYAACQRSFRGCSKKSAGAVVGEDVLFVTTCCKDTNDADRCLTLTTKADSEPARADGFARGKKIIADAGLPTNRCRRAAVYTVATGEAQKN